MPVKFRHDQLERGVTVEREHEDLYQFIVRLYPDFPFTLDQFATWIATAHLREFDNYYDWLDSMEAGARADRKHR